MEKGGKEGKNIKIIKVMKDMDMDIYIYIYLSFRLNKNEENINDYTNKFEI